MSEHRLAVFANRYRDSIALLAVAAELSRLEGVEAATVVMATPANIAVAVESGVVAPGGLGDTAAGPNDILVAVRGSDDACARALELAQRLVSEVSRPGGQGRAAGAEAPRPAAFSAAVRHVVGPNLALVSVPGAYAAAEAHKALRLGMHVLLFSDNVTVEDEIALKAFGAEAGLLVMGPDCGTAIIAGVPLGFANAVRRGPIGVIGASGTGTQEVTCRAHRAGSGISHAIGTGGRDLSDAVGAATARQALAALAADDATEVIVVVSKPPGHAVLGPFCDALAACGKPVVAAFVGADPDVVARPGVVPAATLAAAADLAVGLVGGTSGAGRQPLDEPLPPPPTIPPGGIVRGAFAGGTFCHEAAVVLGQAGVSGVHTDLIDFGDDAYTVGRPHPMIDPTVRDAHVATVLADPQTAVVIVDVVLGHGATTEPTAGLCAAIRSGIAARELIGGAGPVAIVGHVCGTDDDPQDRGAAVGALRAAGVVVAGSNAAAAAWAAASLGAIVPASTVDAEHGGVGSHA